ncbi:DUF2723 domain-containing protein [Olivibacter domesticus]|uniref:DUF2723 domain-containing protein n=1 Tax=Olivibacter domesticus TaxID=407022 RepID=A0A1H7XGM9_OLID1|nr:DUF2723 domain-containing protein [Olivibacter domesticus]SEM32956.1 Protein of unknown function [Olivibacter domesticus]
MNYNKTNNLLGWITFFVSTLVYVLTLEPTASYWDCGEFIAAAYKMQIVHQPGAPLFLMLQNIFSNLAFGNKESLAYWMNFGSAVSSGLTIMFLFWTITALARKVLWKNNTEITQSSLIQIMGAGLVGALAYAVSDTFWFSAVESEVYAMSSLCTAIVFWAILKWEAHVDEPRSDKWLLFIAYIMGLSIGVHLLNLLTIPALALVVYFKRTKSPTNGGVFKTLLIGIVIVAFVLWGIIQYLIKFAAYFDLFFVNSLSLGFGSGVLCFMILVVGGLTYGIFYSIKHVKPHLNIILLSICFIIFGYGSFAMILVRAKADPTLNNSDPDNAFSFLSYLNREQYGEEPLVKGPYFTSKVTDRKEGGNTYIKGEEKYENIGKKYNYIYDRETVFPRIYSSDAGRGHPQFYRSWLNMGESEEPTFGNNLNFFFTYQIGHMYARYFFWNFVGRQNDQKGDGSFTEGNWITGIKPIDQARLGGQDALPDSVKTDPSNNKFYGLPLILGLIGALWHFKRNQKDAGIVGLLFFFTGLAIVLYLNQTPLQPRERDYAYAGSFYAFAIWIGLGVAGIADILQKKTNPKTAGLIATVVGLLAAPILMAKDGWDDHDRSTKYVARDLAKNYLESCAPNAILFTYGDNDTYPLWYVQEVENFRPDVRIVNLSLLSADWYVRQMKDKVNESAPLPITMKDSQFKQGTRDGLSFLDRGFKEPIELSSILDVLLSDNPNDQVEYQDGSRSNYLFTKNFKLTVNREEVLKNKVVPAKWDGNIVDTMVWNYNKDYVSKAELAMFDILVHNNWKRPIYFATTVPNSNYMGLDNYLINEGFALKLMPIKFNKTEEEMRMGESVNTEALYNNTMNKFVWGDLAHARYLDHESYGMLSLIVNNFSTLSQSLYEEGKKEEAKKALARCLEVIPQRIYSLGESRVLYFLCKQLYQAGLTDKANALLERNATYVDGLLKYYIAIAKTKPNLEMQNIQMGTQVIYSSGELAKEYKQEKQAKAMEKSLNEIETMFSGTQGK